MFHRAIQEIIRSRRRLRADARRRVPGPARYPRRQHRPQPWYRHPSASAGRLLRRALLPYRRAWIIAALREDEAHTSIILAVDPSGKLIGADHAAREFLKTTGRRFEPGLTIAEFFGCEIASGRERRYCDVALHVRSCDASSPWLALITPPDLGAVQGRGQERLQVHTRPGMRQRPARLASIGFTIPHETCKRRGIAGLV